LKVHPRVRIDVDGVGDEFREVVVLWDGRRIRQQLVVGGGLAGVLMCDYEAPFGRPVTYSVTGKTTSGWVEVFSEDWSDLSGWETLWGSPAVSGGWLTTGSVSRSDVIPPSGAFQIVLDDETVLDPAGVGRVGTSSAHVSLTEGGTLLRLLVFDVHYIPVDAGK